jgi:hypothetical protein
MRKRLNTKRRGEVVELAFLYKATKLGLIVSKPYGDSAPYDFVVDNGRKVCKVQVKWSNYNFRNGYIFHCSQHNVPYREGDVDIFACYVPDYDAWFLIPAARIHPHLCLIVHPHLEEVRKKYDRYRDAWWIFGNEEYDWPTVEARAKRKAGATFPWKRKGNTKRKTHSSQKRA